MKTLSAMVLLGLGSLLTGAPLYAATPAEPPFMLAQCAGQDFNHNAYSINIGMTGSYDGTQYVYALKSGDPANADTEIGTREVIEQSGTHITYHLSPKLFLQPFYLNQVKQGGTVPLFVPITDSGSDFIIDPVTKTASLILGSFWVRMKCEVQVAPI